MRLPTGLFLVVGLIVWAGCQTGADLSDPAVQEAITESRNLGLAYLEENRLDDAETAFSDILALNPDDAAAHANLGIVYLRRGDFGLAEAALNEALERNGQDPAVRLSLSEVYLQQDRLDEARNVLQAGLDTTPDHVPTLYKRAQLEADEPEDAESYARLMGDVVRRAPSNIVPRLFYLEALISTDQADSALVQLDQIRQQLPELPREAQPHFEQAASALMEGNTAGAELSARFFHNLLKVTSYYQTGLRLLGVRTDALAGAPVISEPPGLTQNAFFEEGADANILDELQFTDASTTAQLAAFVPAGMPAIPAVADINGDGEIDVFVATWDENASTSTYTLLTNTFGRYADVTEASGLTGNGSRVTGARWADIDNDTFLDLYVVTEGDNQLFMNQGDGSFSEVGSDAGLTAPGPGGAPLFADLDHDGDLDLIIPTNGLDLVFRNNTDGTFTENAAAMGLAGASNTPTLDVDFGDFDDDGDLDLFITYATGPKLFTNARQGRFEEVALPDGTPASGNASAVGDYNNDGLLDIAVFGENDGALLLNEGQNVFSLDDAASGSLSGARATQSALSVDFDNDGFLDLATAGNGIRLFQNSGEGTFNDESRLLQASPSRVTSIAFQDYNLDRDLDLYAGGDEGLFLLRNDGGHLNKSLSIQTRGLLSGNSKNNYYSIGAKVEVRAGDLYQVRVVTEPITTVGLGKRLKADVIRIVFTNGVPQNIFRPGTDQDIIEQQILKGSCPFLYTWNGSEFVFVKDFLWRSALGMPLGIMGGERQYAPPSPAEDYIRIPGEILQPKEGHYHLRLTAELWEVPYLDEVRLMAIDHPDSVEVFVDEKFGPPPALPLPLYAVASPYLPVTALDGNGKDVLDLLSARDEQYVGQFELGRYQGLAAPHDLILDPGSRPPDALFLQGWVFPTDASINVALSQNPNAASRPPEVQVINAAGQWETVIPNMGFPMGKRKTMRVALAGLFKSPDYRIRIRTTMQLYWDRAFFTFPEAEAPVLRTEILPTSADFRYRGFSEMYRTSPFGPHLFDYSKTSTESPWLPIPGPYTRYGDVRPLLEQSEGAYVIMAPGDEIAISFPEDGLPALPEGWKRDFVLYSNGWLKDADLNTAEGGTVEPLPFPGMQAYPYAPTQTYPRIPALQNYHTEYNTRIVSD